MACAFDHPGIPLTVSDLNTVMGDLDREPWKSGFARLKADGRSSPNYTMAGPFQQVSRKGAYDQYLGAWRSDMSAVYQLSLMWYFTKDDAYAKKAHDILIAWATTNTTFNGNESGLDLGDYVPCFAGGASILRGTWPGWTVSDTTAVKSWFGNILWYASLIDSDAIGPANKGSLYMASGIGIATFCDDQARFDHVIELLRANGAAGLRNTLATGEMGETGRDQGHSYNDLRSRAFVAEVAWKQGIDLYSEMDNRLLACGEYYARNNVAGGGVVQFVPFGTIDYNYYQNTGSAGAYFANSFGLDLIRGAYKIRKGMSTPWLDQKIANQDIDLTNWIFRKSADTSTASPMPAITFPSTTLVTTGLTNTAIGTSTAGSSSFANGTWTVQGNGANVWTKGADSCQFVYKQITGDCALIARVTGVQATSTNAKAGVMIRETLDPTTPRRAWVAITAATNLESYMTGWTSNWGGTGWDHRSQGVPSLPYWVKIERRGGTITTFTSQDGTSWAASNAPAYADLPSTVYIGLFVCAEVTDTTLNTATFTHVAITGGNGAAAPLPAAPAAMMSSPNPSSITLRWLPSYGATAYDLLRSTTSGSGYTVLAGNLGTATTSYIDTSAVRGTTYYYVVRAKNAAGTSGNSPEEQSTLSEMTMPNIAFGGTASASASKVTEGAANAFDGISGTKWFNDGAASTGWIQYDFGAGNDQTIKRYSITSANDVPERDPKDWTLQGSLDGLTWTIIDTQNGQLFPYRLQMQTYAINSPGSYRYYRLNVTANNGAPALQIGDIGLYSDVGRTVPDGTYRLLSRRSNKAVSVKDGATANNTPLVQLPYANSSSQMWVITYLGNGQYQIIGSASNKAAEISGASTANGAGVDIYPYAGTANQKWTITPTQDGYFKLTAVNSGKVMDVAGGRTTDGTGIIQWPYGGGTNQQWSVATTPVSSGTAVASLDSMSESLLCVLMPVGEEAAHP